MKLRTKLLLAAAAMGVILAVAWLRRPDEPGSDWLGIQFAKFESYDGGASHVALLNITNRTEFVLTFDLCAQGKVDGEWREFSGSRTRLGRAALMPAHSGALIAVKVPKPCQVCRPAGEVLRPKSRWEERRYNWAQSLTKSKLGWLGKIVAPRTHCRWVCGPELPPPP